MSHGHSLDIVSWASSATAARLQAWNNLLQRWDVEQDDTAKTNFKGLAEDEKEEAERAIPLIPHSFDTQIQTWEGMVKTKRKSSERQRENLEDRRQL